jgi:hypothetical protein
MHRFFRLLPLLFLLAWLSATPAWAQDTIIDLQGNEFSGQVVEITPTQVLYRAPDTESALPPTVLDKSTLFMVRFANGTKEVFSQNLSTAQPEYPPAIGFQPGTPETAEQHQLLWERGRQDALRYYRRSSPALGTIATATLSPLNPLGAIIIGAVRPKAYKNPLLDPEMLKYPTYVEGYERTAHQRKAWPVIGGYLAGTVLGVILYSALSTP